MPAKLIDGTAIGAEMRKELGTEISGLKKKGIKPGLAVVLVGDNPASEVYVRMKGKACEEAGMYSVTIKRPKETSEADLLQELDRLNNDAAIHGILVQLPLPKGLDANAVTRAIDPAKDVDGLTPHSAGCLLLGLPSLVPCTPQGIMKILERCAIPLEGANAVVIGRSNIVGKPISLLLQRANATVTMCHSKTRDLRAVCREADVLVAAVGVPRLVRGEWIKPGAAVIDVGVSLVDGVLTGDVDTEGVQGVARIVTPHRRGVGPMTITMLLQNTLQAYEQRSGA